MKKLLLPLLLFPLPLLAQDYLTLNGEEFKVRVVNETRYTVTFYPFDNPDRPLTTLSRRYIQNLAYEPGSRPERRDNKIVVGTTDGYEQTVRNLVNLLAEQGYGLVNIDEKYGQILTAPRPFRDGSLVLNISVRQEEAVSFTIQGVFSSGTSTVVYGGGVGATFQGDAKVWFNNRTAGAMRRAWNEMEKVARQYPQATLSYQGRPSN